MDTKFKKMLIEAEKIRAICRRNGDISPHKKYMRNMTKYGVEKGFLAGSESEEYLGQAAEMAACILEVIYKEEIGSILNFSPERKRNIMKSAQEKAEARFKSIIECGC